MLHSLSPLRHAFYETFLHLHQLGAFLAFLGVYLHIDLDALPQRPWIIAVGVLWLLDRLARVARLLYLNVSAKKGSTRVVVEALAGEACRVTFHLPKRVHVKPGGHVYAYIPSISQWMSHPFSIAWVEPSSCVTTSGPMDSPVKTPTTGSSMSPSLLEKQPLVNLDRYMPENKEPTSVSLIVAARQGMTRKLYNRALAAPNQVLYTTGFIEGPYASHVVNLGSYGTVVLFSGGVGITHHMLSVRDLIIRAAEGRVATQKIYLIWSVRNTEHLAWVREWMDQVLRLPGRREMLTVKLFVSKPKSSREIVSPSATVQMFPGRCRPQVVMDEVLPQRVGATVVSACGSGGFSDEVRAAARDNIGKGAVVDFVEEAFTW
ncbi:ferric reductase family protein [Aspergillus tanneri]|nr:uncharacterized protein ATNIH1004_000547 [Aspergillus tanneri]KAA8651656.1 hypothetical protein ATNIH1004_000547 [Aspergillus tanneri]